MKIGIGPYYYKKYGGKAGAERMLSHGYEYMDFDWYANTEGGLYPEDEAEFIRVTEELRDKFNAKGYKVRQIHGPWRSTDDYRTEEQRAERYEKTVRAIRAAAIIGAKYMAIHPIMPFGVGKHTEREAEEAFLINVEFYTRLAKVGEENGVYVCLENMPFPDFPISSSIDIMRVVRAVNNPYFRVCLDTGHANVVKPDPAESVHIIGKDNLLILHVHGNDGKDDLHYNPMKEGDTVDWEAFSAALREIDFEGVVNLETSPRTGDTYGEAADELEIKLAEKAKSIAGM